MAYSTQRAVSDGTLTYLDLSIGYQSRGDIKVFYNDLPASPSTWAWVGTTDKRIAFTPAVPNGVEVLVQRATRLDRIINVFAAGAKFTNVTMDMNFEQVLFLTQEAVEGSALSDIFNDVDFHNYKIKNLGLATDDTDAITFGQVKSFGTGAYAAQLAAEAARDLAQLWATKPTTTVDGTSYSAKQYAANAGVAAAASANSATASQTSATNSASSAAASQTSRLASEAARDRSEAARDRAEGAAAPATEIYDRLDAIDAIVDTIPPTFVESVAGLSGIVTVSALNAAAGPTAPVSTPQQNAINVAVAAAVAAAQANATPVGTYILAMRKSTPPGNWMAAVASTFGNVGSGATVASALTEALFTLWWTDFTNAEVPLFTSAGVASVRGPSAAADWAALKRMTTLNMDRVFGRQVPNGSEIAQFVSSQLPNHSHSIPVVNAPGSGGTGGIYWNGTGGSPAGNLGTANSGGGLGAGTEVAPPHRGLLGFYKL